MNIKRFTLIAGIFFVLVAIAGFIPGLNVGPHAHDPSLGVEGAYGRLFGLFPVNVLHNLVHLAFGIWALVAAKSVAQSIFFNRANAVIYGVLAVAGLFPGLNTLFGIVPLFSHDVWLHAGIALATGYFGFVAVRRETGVPSPLARQHGTYIHP